MLLKILGVILVIAGCGSVGFRIAANYRQEEKSLRQLIGILDFMECELQYRLTPLPELCRQTAREFSAMPGKVFHVLALEMEAQILPNMERCMAATLEKMHDIPTITRNGLSLLGKSIGRFDLDGQLKGLEAVRQDCRRNLESLCNNRDSRLRSYQTLGLCAGAALAILFI
ncbi:MAG: stage III sporulation protein AB [Oscillospiraceae bacterium]|nr:stage III sporulation protein AB [Oscillospiraceae bacterium]